MKYITYAYKLVSLVILLGFTSCNDWLDVHPASQIEDTELFSTQTGFKEALSGVYSSMISESTYTKELLYGMIGVLGHEWDNYPTTYQDLITYDYTATTPTSLISSIWSTSYNSIVNANNLLAHIDEKQGIFTDNNYYIIKGEALALRAFLHFDLLRCFGVSYEQNPQMPAISYCTDMTYRVTAQSTVEEVAQYIEQDLLEAAELLVVDPIYTGETITELDDDGYLMNRQVHLNYYAVKGLLARLYMWMQRYDDARTCAQEVIDSEVFTWADPTMMSSGEDYACASEHLFGLNNANMSTLADTYFNIESNTTTFSVNVSTLLEYFDQNTSDYRYLYLFVSGDGSLGDLVNYRFLTKYMDSESDDSYYQDKMAMIKLSEMYLIVSECDYRTSGGGLEALNTLRVARNVLALDVLPSDYYTELIREYRREFIGEGQLFFMYKRLNRETVIGSDVDMITEKAYTFPLPLSETEVAEREDNR